MTHRGSPWVERKEALQAKKAAGVKLGRPRGSGKSRLDSYQPEIEGSCDVLDAVAQGGIEGGCSAPGYYSGKHWAAIPLSHGPVFGMDVLDFYGWYWEGGGSSCSTSGISRC